ncbi:MAG: GNAT family N-acetyltransferase [Bacteroidota bacterium]|nr:GNAT family N-acetyltransferase [Bacteroidota bacterium]
MIQWQCKKFNELTVEELYKILHLRNEVFVVEQNCPYQDCDGKDAASYHLCGWHDGELKAYTRILPPGLSYPNAASIGRVVTSPSARGQQLGKQLMTKSLEQLYRLFGDGTVLIGAQLYLKKFYEAFSFIQNGEVYLEDGIPHITMEKTG